MEEEPSYDIVPGSNRDIQFLVSAVADYSQFSCSVTEIFYKDTLMFEVNSSSTDFIIILIMLVDIQSTVIEKFL